MKILVIGSGGREHALVWAFNRSAAVKHISCAPGNGGITELATCVRADVANPQGLADLVEQERIDLTFVGPEMPLVKGVVDEFTKRNLRIVGPTSRAAQLEGSKVFAKEFMARHGIPTAGFAVCDTADEAKRVIASGRFNFPVVLKADGLAAGKGVIIAHDRREAEIAIEQLMIEKTLGSAGDRLVIEECLSGRECSFLLFTDGESVLPLVAAQDYKRALDHDQGPNTGGMGSISTPGLINDATRQQILTEFAEPTIRAAAKDGIEYKGVLYIGLMLTGDGPRVLEYNARLGDPETQVILPRLETDLTEICEAVLAGELHRITPTWSDDSTVCVVLASGGYPGHYDVGFLIQGVKDAEASGNVVVFHAGTHRTTDGQLHTAGGRVLGVTARGKTLTEAVARAYQAASLIMFEKMHYRRDIGKM
jgi:phosphoribosylamine--glycine ligase